MSAFPRLPTALALAALTATALPALATTTKAEPSRRDAGGAAVQARAALSGGGVLFERNDGQDPDSSVRYRARLGGGTARFTDTSLMLTIPTPAAGPHRAPRQTGAGAAMRGDEGLRPMSATSIRVGFVRPSSSVHLTGVARTPTTVNYLRGNVPGRWQTGVPTHKGVRYGGLWEGVDLHYDAPHGALKGTYRLAPHTNPAVIGWRYHGATVRPGPGGSLTVTPTSGAGSTVVEDTPVAWQDTPGGRVPVRVSYRVARNGSVGFDVGAHDPSQPLVIDPTITWSKVMDSFGGYSSSHAIGSDKAGNVMLGGMINSEIWTSAAAPVLAPTAPANGVQRRWGGNSDGFVAKIDKNGALVWFTYLGGADDDDLHGLDVDPAGRIAFTGMTHSADFPVHRERQRRDPTYTRNPNDPQAPLGDSITDAVLGVLNPDGRSLVFSTYLASPGYDWGQTIRFTSDGGVALTGKAWPGQQRGEVDPARRTLKATPGAYRDRLTEAFVARFTKEGRQAWLATLGATRPTNQPEQQAGSGDDLQLRGLDLGPDGSIYLAGSTASPYAPTTAGTAQPRRAKTDTGWTGWVGRLSADGRRLLWGSYLGGRFAMFAAVGVDAERGAIWVLGQTETAPPFPARNCTRAKPGARDALAVRLTQTGRVTAAACVGGNRDEHVGLSGAGYNPVSDLRVDPAGNVYLLGTTRSEDFPIQNAPGGNPGVEAQPAAFVASLNHAGTARWSGVLRGSPSTGEASIASTFGDRGGLALLPGGRVAVALMTSAPDYPGRDPASFLTRGVSAIDLTAAVTVLS